MPRAIPPASPAPTRVLVVGGGVGGLEAALALRAYGGESLRVDMLAPKRHFTYRPLSVGEPFGGASTVQIEIAAIAEEVGFGLVRDALDRVDTDSREAHTQDGAVLPYDALLLSTGARQVEAVPGALTFRGPRDTGRLTDALERLEGLAQPRVAVVIPPGASWPLPGYELALLTAGWLRRQDLPGRILLVTAEGAPLSVFGSEGSERVAAALERAGIEVQAGSMAFAVERGVLRTLEGRHEVDLTIALPILRGAPPVGIPADTEGFVPVDHHCRVIGVDGVYAAGDMTDHPTKQGGLAAQQADVAAAAIAAGAGVPVEVRAFSPVLRAMLLTGGRPLYLRHPPADAREAAEDHDGAAPWWPAHKIVGTHLSPYLATHAHLMTPAPVHA